MSYVGIIFRPRLIALVSFSFLFIFSLLSLQHIENCNAQECFSTQGRKKIAHGCKFSNPASTGRKVEMASANTE